jgi:hypothetical protein
MITQNSVAAPEDGRVKDRPQALAVQTDNIPNALAETLHWVAWNYVEEVDPASGEICYDKPPVNARTGSLAKSTAPSTWCGFIDAVEFMRRRKLDGIGFVLHRTAEQGDAPGLVGIDLDKCRDPQTGAVEPWAREVIERLATYTEVSPSGRGLRAFLLGKLPPSGRKKGPVEMYETGRYVTVTGHKLDGFPATVETRQEQLLALHAQVFGWEEEKDARPPTGDRAPLSVDDEAILDRAFGASNGAAIRRLWEGDVGGYGSHSEADLALCSHLAFYVGRDEQRIADLFSRSGLSRSKWQREDYRKRTIARALKGKTEFYRWGPKPSANGNGRHYENGKAEPTFPTAKEWEPPVPLGEVADAPEFPARCLPAWMRDWILAEAEATQTPPDLAGMLVLSIAGAGLATKYRVRPRQGWTEPTNLFCVVSLPPGERKSAVFLEVLRPVLRHEADEQSRMEPIIAEAEAERRMLESRMKQKEQKAARSDDEAERNQLKAEAKELARELARFVVPASPQYYCDDCTAEALGKLLAGQGGRVLQAAAEGTAFEIAKGRYSETANFDVYLKGHAGDPLRTNRVSRDKDSMDRPALSVALAVQPDVLRGLGEQATMRGRGFLARFLYATPVSRVGSRTIRPEPVPPHIDGDYFDGMSRVWATKADEDDKGNKVPHWLRFSEEADALLEDFERWLEPLLAPEARLSHLAGWAQKLAGAVVRIAGILHAAAAVVESQNIPAEISADTVRAAVTIGRDYLLPHAEMAFGVMYAHERTEDARRVVAWLAANWNSLNSLNQSGVRVVKRSELHEKVFGGRRDVDAVAAVVEVLVKHCYLEPVEDAPRPGRGRKPSSRFVVNPHLVAERVAGNGSENSANGPRGRIP